MPKRWFIHSTRGAVLALILSSFVCRLEAQSVKQKVPETPISGSDANHMKERNEWFYRGRLVREQPSAELRRRAYLAKLRLRAQRAAALAAASVNGQTTSSALSSTVPALSSGSWVSLGPVPLASDASGNGTQDYHQVAGRATAIAIDPADATGNTVYIGGAQSGIWKSSNAATVLANNVTWTPVSDDQATLSIGAITIQPGNADPATSLILAATGEANDSSDSYFGLGILRSADAGNSWSLIGTANGGALSFSGLGGTQMAFSSANTVVAAMATSSEGVVDGAVTTSTTPGLYTSLDAGQSWTYNAPTDAGAATDAMSATAVAYNAIARMFFAAVRYHGFYSSPDGMTWTRLTTQPGGTALSTSACPPQSTANNQTCPIYRGEITVVPARNEMYAWYIYLSANGSPVDGGIWQSLNGGASWTAISDTGITNCGDVEGCGVEQGAYNLELLAVPNGATATDLYAGAINLYKCGISTLNPTCTSTPFLNLTHTYGCDPIAAPSHVHPDQHALGYMIPASGGDSGNALMYFANDGGIYRALDGYTGLITGACSGINAFDDLNQNLGSMTQFVGFSQHPTDQNTMLGGAQGNGSPATSEATTNSSWGNVLGGDGGYNAIDPTAVLNWYATNPDIPPGGLGVQLCTSGVNCTNSGFSFVVTSDTVGGDDGAFYFPYILDPSTSAMLVGTCRVWRGPRTGGAFTALSPNFDTLGSGTCSGSEVNQVRALAAGGIADSQGASVIYATTSGSGPLDGPLSTPPGGHVWVTTDATTGPSAFADVTDNGPQGNINPNQFPISGVALDSSDNTGSTAYVTVMGFTGGSGHVWKTTNAGATWTDFTANLPDSPANAVLVYPPMSQVYVATDVGVFGSSTSTPSWTEVGPSPSPTQAGFLPNVAVTGLGVFASGGAQLLRASTYGRGIWQFNLVTTPDFQLTVSDSPQTISAGQTATFAGTATALNGYSNSVSLSCAVGITAPPSTCTLAPSALTPGVNSPFTITSGGTVGDYYFDVQGIGADSHQTTHQTSVVLHILSNSPDFALSEPTAFPTVNAGSSSTSGQISVTAENGFTGSIALSCSLISGSGSCSVNPSSVTTIPTTANVTVNASALSAGSYQLLVQGTSGSTTHSLVVPFNVGDYQLSGTQSLTVGLGAQGTDSFNVVASTYYGGIINASCNAASEMPGASCTFNPSPVVVNVGGTVPVTATINVPVSTAPETYNFNINMQDETGAPSHSLPISLVVTQNFSLNSSVNSQTVTAGQTSAAYNLTIAPVGTSFTSPINLSCSGLPAGAQCIFNPSGPITPGKSSAAVAMTISTTPTTGLGTYSITVTATSGSLSHSVIVSLVVSGDFQLAVTQAFPLSVDAGSSQTAKVSITPNYSGWVDASCDASAILGAQCSVTPANPVVVGTNTATTLTVVVNLPNTMTPGPYTVELTVADQSGSPSHTQALTLTVIQDFSVTSSTASQTVSAGQTTGPYQLTVAPNPPGSTFSGTVALSCGSGLPAGAQCVFSPSAVTPETSAADVVMSISTAAASSAGTYSVTVTGSSGSLAHSTAAPVALVVTNGATSPAFQMAVTQPFPSNVDAGTAVTAKVSVTPNYSGQINANCDASSIAGAQCSITPVNPVAITANTAAILTVSLSLPNNAAAKTDSVNVTVSDSSGEPSQSLQPPLALTVIEDFSLSSATPTQTVTAGNTTGAYQLTVAPNPSGSSFDGAVTLSCSSDGLPAGAQCLFSPSTAQTPGNSAVDVVMTIATAATSANLPTSRSGAFDAVWGLFPGLVFSWVGLSLISPKQKRFVTGLATAVLLVLFLPCCSGISAGGSGGSGGNPATYTITVVGTSGSLSHSIQVDLVVQ